MVERGCQFAQQETVGRQVNRIDAGSGNRRGNDADDVFVKEGLASGDADFANAQAGQETDDADDLFGHAVNTTEIASFVNGDSHINKYAAELVDNSLPVNRCRTFPQCRLGCLGRRFLENALVYSLCHQRDVPPTSGSGSVNLVVSRIYEGGCHRGWRHEKIH